MSFTPGSIKRSIPIVTLLTLASAAKGAEAAAPLSSNARYTGSPSVRTWLADDYGAHPENTWVRQHPRTYPTGNMSWPIVIAAKGSAVVGGSDDSNLYYFTP